MKCSSILAISLAVCIGGCGRPTDSVPTSVDSHDDETHTEDNAEIVIHLEDSAQAALGLELSPAGPGTIRLTTELPGEVQVNGDRMAHVTPRVSGVVTEVRKSLGDRVQAGEILAMLESRELADLKAQYLGAIARLELAQAAYDREHRLYKQRVSAEQDYLDAQNARSEARIGLRSAQQKLLALGLTPEYLQDLSSRHSSSLTHYALTAPFAGTVIDRHLVQGESVSADTAVFTVADLSTVWVDLKVYQKDIGTVRSGQEVQLATDHGHEAILTLDFVQPLVGEDTRTALARVEVSNTEGHWHPGCFTTGTVTLKTIAAEVAVPKEAIVQLDDGDFVVFVKDHDGYAPRPLILGHQDHDLAEIVSGLKAGEIYVSKGAFALKSEMLKGSFGHGHAH